MEVQKEMKKCKLCNDKGTISIIKPMSQPIERITGPCECVVNSCLEMIIVGATMSSEMLTIKREPMSNGYD